MQTFNSSSPVWLTGFWGFSPEDEGILGFTDHRDRDRLFRIIDEYQLVCVYGAASPETKRSSVHQLLGVLEVERIPVDSWDKMSETAKARNIALGRQDKWRHAMPVRRAWRTKHNLDVNQVLPRSYDPSNGRYTARFGKWLVPEEAHWLLTKVPFTQTSVFGEAPLIGGESQSNSLLHSLLPSRGIFGAFGIRSFEVHDKPHKLYLASFPFSPELLTGRPLAPGFGLFKIGISSNIENRLKALNLSFPQTSKINWRITRTAMFSDRSSAAIAEAAFKTQSVEEFQATSLGREFFIMDVKKAEALFNKLSPATGLDLRVSSSAAPIL